MIGGMHIFATMRPKLHAVEGWTGTLRPRFVQVAAASNQSLHVPLQGQLTVYEQLRVQPQRLGSASFWATQLLAASCVWPLCEAAHTSARRCVLELRPKLELGPAFQRHSRIESRPLWDFVWAKSNRVAPVTVR